MFVYGEVGDIDCVSCTGRSRVVVVDVSDAW